MVTARDFQPDRRERITMDTLSLEYFDLGGGKRTEIRNQQLTINSFASQDQVRRGNRITLVLDIEMEPGIHIYAPGVEGYTAYAFTLEPQPLVRVIQEAQIPAASMLELPTIGERVPINEGKIRITRDVTISLDPELVEQSRLELTGSFEYQACESDFCHLPVTIPLTWVFEIGRHDAVRVPKAMQLER